MCLIGCLQGWEGEVEGWYPEAELFCLYLFIILGFQLKFCLEKRSPTK